jgi:hypothetical protein
MELRIKDSSIHSFSSFKVIEAFLHRLQRRVPPAMTFVPSVEFLIRYSREYLLQPEFVRKFIARREVGFEVTQKNLCSDHEQQEKV